MSLNGSRLSRAMVNLPAIRAIRGGARCETEVIGGRFGGISV
jgi:hypothetical protein